MFFKTIRDWVTSLVQRLFGIDARAVAVHDLISLVESAAELRDAAKRLQDAHPASAAILLDAATRLESQQAELTAPLLGNTQPAAKPVAVQAHPPLPAPRAPEQLPPVLKRGPGRPRKDHGDTNNNSTGNNTSTSNNGEA
jgi:hypothetical protein